jgi:hypothetical protein
MEKQAKYELMQKVTRELEDLKNSQTAILKKVSQVEADNINLNDRELEKTLTELHGVLAENLEKIEAVYSNYQDKAGQFATANRLTEAALA